MLTATEQIAFSHILLPINGYGYNRDYNLIGRIHKIKGRRWTLMKIDTAIRDFVEGVNREALQSIDELSQESGLVLNSITMQAFNLQESCEKFASYLEGYGRYKVQNLGNPKASDQHAIHESTDRFISSDQLFQETSIKYPEVPGFIKSYVTGIQRILEAVDTTKSMMMEADVDHEAIGDVNEFTDQFMDRLHEHFKPWMEKVLWESGYTAKQRLFGKKKQENAEPKPVFL